MPYLMIMVTVITFYNAYTTQYYIRLVPGVVDDAEKQRLLKVMNAEPAAKFHYNQEPRHINLLYFQEFDEPNTAGVYWNLNGDRPHYDGLYGLGREPEYVI
jgi:hypothetical protein